MTATDAEKAREVARSPRSGLSPEDLDQILALQLLVAWAGEANTTLPRLGFWRTAMAEEYGGEDLFQRLMPRTYRWAVLEAARLAAKKVDALARERTADADQLISLFRFDFALDERLDDRLAELKRSTEVPWEALPALKPVASGWDRPAFEGWLAELPKFGHSATPTGRQLKGPLPEDRLEAARALCAALLPLSDGYPAPYFRTGR